MSCCTTTVFTRQDTLCEKIQAGTIAKELCRMANISITVLTTLGERIKYPWGQYADAICKGCVIPCDEVKCADACNFKFSIPPSEVTGIEFEEGQTAVYTNPDGNVETNYTYTEGAWVADAVEGGEAKRKAL